MSEEAAEYDGKPTLVERLKRRSWGSDSLEQEAIDRIAELEGQLPDEMQDCTIVFEPCDKGHGTLRGTNWLKVDCPYCRIDALIGLLRCHITGNPCGTDTVMIGAKPDCPACEEYSRNRGDT